MGLFRTVGRREARDSGFTRFLDIGTPTHAGISVTQDAAPNLPAIYRCWSLNADTVASIPVDTLAKLGDRRAPYPEPFWLREPNEEQDWPQFIHQAQLSLEADGNAFILKLSNAGGNLTGLRVLAPGNVEVKRDAEGRIVYVVKGGGGQETFAATAIMHIRWMVLPGQLRGLSPVMAAKQTIGTAFAAEQFGANFFGSGATVSGVIAVPGKMKTEDADRLRDQFKKKHGGVSKSHAIGVLTDGAEWKQLSVNPEESQFLETRKFTDAQIANLYGVPPEYVTALEGAKGYVTGLYARQYMWLQTGINPRLLRIEQAFSRLLARPAYIKFNRNSFLAMDPAERKDFYAAGQLGRWITQNEIREKEDMDPLPGGDELLWSVQWQPPDRPDMQDESSQGAAMSGPSLLEEAPDGQ